MKIDDKKERQMFDAWKENEPRAFSGYSGALAWQARALIAEQEKQQILNTVNAEKTPCTINADSLIEQVEAFKREALKMHLVQCWAESYASIDSAFSYHITSDSGVFFMREQARQLWAFWSGNNYESE